MKATLVIIFIISSLSASSQNRIWDEPQNINILNSQFDEFAPVLNKYSNQLFFNSTKSGYSMFYITELNEKNAFLNPILVSGELNSENNNQSYITFESKEIAYLSTFRKFDSRSYLNIFQTRKKKNQWLKPFKIDSLVTPCFMGHPTISPDGKLLIFSSDYNTEFGDTDLWMAFKQENGTWGTIIKMIQTQSPGNEITPFLASNDTLFFASDGQEGPGGYDIFMSVRIQGIWGMPYPISELNTEFDESDFSIISDNSAVFASNRPGGFGGLDLYQVVKVFEKTESPIISDIDFSLVAQVPFIKVEGESIRKTSLLNPVFIYNSELFEKNNNNLDFLKNDNYKFIEIHSIALIAERFKIYPDASLLCTIYSGKVSEQIQNEIKEKINSFFSTDLKTVKINFAPLSKNITELVGNNTYLLKFSSSDKRMFEFFDINITPIKSIIPPALDLSIDARPRNQIVNWKISILIDDEINDTIKSGNELPFNFYHSISNYSKEINSNDSLSLLISATDTLGNKYSHLQTLTITHSDIEDNGTVMIDEKNYAEYWLTVFDEKDLKDEFLYTPSFRFLSEKGNKKKKIIINYFSAKAKQKAIGIKNYLSEQINGGELLIELSESKDFENYLIEKYQEFAFKIQIEI